MNATPPLKPERGEDMNVRHVHAAIWREFAEPREMWRRTPWYLRHLYACLFIWLVLYLTAWMGQWDWNEYEESGFYRSAREHARPLPATPPPAINPYR